MSKEKPNTESIHMKMDELAIPEVRFTDDNDDFEDNAQSKDIVDKDEYDDDEFIDETEQEEIGMPQIDYSGAIPEIHIIKKK